MRKINILLAVIISIASLFFAFYKVNFNDVLLGFKKIRFIFVLLMIFIFIVYFIIRAYRWGLIFKPNPIPGFKSLFSSIMIGAMVNNVFPAKIGEIARAFVIGQREKISVSLSFGTIIVERIFDFLALFFSLIILFLVSETERSFLLKPDIKAFRVFFYMTVLGFVFLLVFLIFFKIKTAFSINIIKKIMGFFSKKFTEKGKIDSWVNLFVQGLRSLDDFRNAIYIFVVSMIQWLIIALITYIGLHSFNLNLSFTSAYLVTILVVLGTVIPPSPGGIGTTQLFSVIALSFYGVSQADALSFSIVYNFIGYFMATLIGWYFFIREGLRFKELIQGSGSLK
ncbi:MAG: lysylphosphatidylglycerol synthase transmembrane domain-containing protein [Candidatus Firestonebacteria bacterium]